MIVNTPAQSQYTQCFTLNANQIVVLHFDFKQDDVQYFWASSEAGGKQRKTSWKMSKGSLGPRNGEEGESKPGARYTEAEWQQMVMGLKRENKESIEKLRKEQDEALFKVRAPLSEYH